MVIFIMMLVSTALMYYYFQRTRALEREVTALRSGESREADPGLFSYLPWNVGPNKAAPQGTQVPAPVHETASPETGATTPGPPAAGMEMAEETLPPTGTASTPRPGAESSANERGEPAYGALTLNSINGEDSEILPSDETAPGSDRSMSSDAAEGEPDSEATESGEVNSMYDAPPQVRVRAPRRD